MSTKIYYWLTALIFLLIGFFHLLRIAFGWTVVLQGWPVPMWLSWVALAVAALVTYSGFRIRNE